MLKNIKKIKKINLGIVIIIIVFLIVVVVTKLLKVTDLPLQTIGVLFGAVITALITYFLLLGQSQAEEIKERNVRVFEEKSERFNTFINKLWNIWDDRVVSLEELNELIKLVSKDIVLYTKPETVDKILSHLIVIAEKATPDKSNNKDAESTRQIQDNIFDIINELAKEIGLGGELKPEIRVKLNTLEEKVIPFLIQKNFKKNYIENFIETIEKSEDEIDISKIEYKNKFLWCNVKNSNLFIQIGPLERDKKQPTLIGLYVEYWDDRNIKYRPYLDASRGFRKDYIKGTINFYDDAPEFMINFSDYDALKKLNETTESDSTSAPWNKLAFEIIKRYKSWKVDGKNIEEIIDECASK